MGHNISKKKCDNKVKLPAEEVKKNQIFTINETIEKEVKEKCGVPNWGEMIFGMFDFPLRKKLIETTKSNTSYNLFILGVQYEYGIECEIDLNKALFYYKQSASLKETFALYKLYNVYCYESDKFRVKRDREQELFYLFQSVAYSDGSLFIYNDTFLKIDFVSEIFLIMDLEENFEEKMKNLFLNIKPIEPQKEEISYVEYIINMKIYTDDAANKDKYLKNLEELGKLAEKKHMESCYKLAVIFQSTDKFYAEFLFRNCIKEKFTKAFFDYGLFLFTEGKITDAIEILEQGINYGNFRCYFAYYNLLISILDMEKNYMNLIDLSKFLITDILMGNVFSIFDFFFKRKILIKHFNVPEDMLNNEYVENLAEVCKKALTDKDLILRNFSVDIVYRELLLSCGFIHYIGALGKPDYGLAERSLKASLKFSSGSTTRRFCYSYIFKVKMHKLADENQKLNSKLLYNVKPQSFYKIPETIDIACDNNCKEIFEDKKSSDKLRTNIELKYNKILNNQAQINIFEENHNNDKPDSLSRCDDEKQLINVEKKIAKIKIKLYKFYYETFERKKIQHFTSSYLYYMSKIHENGWGCKQDDIFSYCYLLHARDWVTKSLGTGSIITYYRRFKSIKKLESEKYKNVSSDLENLKNKAFEALEDKECCICYEHEANTILFPCKHMICYRCYSQIKETSKCPTCRMKILLTR